MTDPVQDSGGVATAQEADADKACRVCSLSIPKNAVKCVNCGTYQNWRRHLDLSSNVLALLIALFSVMSMSLPVIVKSFSRPNSRLIVSNQGFKDRHGYFAVWNSGELPALIEHVSIEGLYFPFGSRPTIRMTDEEKQAFVAPGFRQIKLMVSFTAGPHARDVMLDLARWNNKDFGEVVGEVIFGVVHFDGRREELLIPLSKSDMISILGGQEFWCIRQPPKSPPDECKSVTGDGDEWLDVEQTMLDDMIECEQQPETPPKAKCIGPSGKIDGPLYKIQIRSYPYGVPEPAAIRPSS